jgi:DNA-binding LytR/AlgR family response regulator
LSFNSEEFIYAASDRNYVDFYLEGKSGIIKKTIRNSMTNVEEQLNGFPQFFRTHRAFLINLKKMEKKQGNALGYDLKLTGINEKIPVARNKIKAFDKQLKKLS